MFVGSDAGGQDFGNIGVSDGWKSIVDSAGSDSIFVGGSLLAARKVQNITGLVRGLDRFLFDDLP